MRRLACDGTTRRIVRPPRLAAEAAAPGPRGSSCSEVRNPEPVSEPISAVGGAGVEKADRWDRAEPDRDLVGHQHSGHGWSDAVERDQTPVRGSPGYDGDRLCRRRTPSPCRRTRCSEVHYEAGGFRAPEGAATPVADGSGLSQRRTGEQAGGGTMTTQQPLSFEQRRDRHSDDSYFDNRYGVDRRADYPRSGPKAICPRGVNATARPLRT